MDLRPAPNRGQAFVDAVSRELETRRLGDQLSVRYVEEMDCIRIHRHNPDGTIRGSVDYPPVLESIHAILDFLRIEARIAGLRREWEQSRRGREETH